MRRGRFVSALLVPLITVMGLSWLTGSRGQANGAGPAEVEVFGAGQNVEGQLAETQINPAIPHPVATVSGVTYSQITVGADHACGLTPTGHAYCWGDNYWGQLGDGETPRLTNAYFSPRLVAAPGNVTWSALSAGSQYTCGVTTNASAYCWGEGSNSKLGVNPSPFLQPIPAPVRDGYRWRTIAAGDDTTCGVTVGGAALCWGFTRTWSGSWSGSTSNAPTTVSASGGLTVGSVRDISVGPAHTCAVTTTNRAYCWGDNSNGALGLGNTTNQNAPQPVVAVTGLGIASVSAIRAGSATTCALSTERSVFCWGYNADGQLGAGDTVRRTSPHPVTTSSGMPQGSVSQVAPSSFGACAVDLTNDAWCWGQGISGRLGDGRRVARLTPTRTVRVPVGVTVSSLALSHISVSHPTVGPWMGCLLTSEGHAWCWRTGDPFTVASSMEPTPPRPMTPPLGRTWIQISAGWSHTCAVDTTRAVWCWGDNAFGQLGTGDKVDSPDPLQVTGLTNVAVVAALSAHTCAITMAGFAHCWGANWSGQLGTGDITDRVIPTPVSVSALPAQTFQAIAPSQDHTCALDAQRRAWCWGDNSNGQLGTGDQQQRLEPTLVNNAVDPTVEFVSLTTGVAHTCAVDTLQRAWCWGYNGQGQVGATGATFEPSPVPITGRFFASVSAADEHTCGVTPGGAVYCWGDNTFGQLGTGDTVASPTPVLVTGLTNIAVLDTGTDRACAASSSGQAWCWGKGLYGALGDAGNADRTTPTMVATTGGLDGRPIIGFALGDGHSWFVTAAEPPPPSPALTPTFGAPVPTADGFTVNVTNHDPAYTWTATATAGTAGTVVTGSAVGAVWPVTVSGLAPGTSANLTVTTTRTGYTTGTATTTGTAQTGLARTPTFSTPVPTADGFTVNVTNFDNNFTWATTATGGTVVTGSAVGAVWPVTVSGLAPGTSATLTVTTTRTGYTTGTATTSATAQTGLARTPTFSTPLATVDGFTVNVTNFDNNFTWATTATGGTVVTGSAVGALWPVTVSGLAPGTSATLTVTTTRTGYTTGTATTTGTAQTGLALIPNDGLPNALNPLITTPAPSTTPTTTTAPATTTTTAPVDARPEPTDPPPADLIRALPESTLLDQDTLEPGTTITVTAAGFTPGKPVQLIVASTPRILTTGRADTTGIARLTGTIPLDLPPGAHTLAIYAPTSGVGVRQTFTVTSPSLPATGTRPAPSLALMLVVLGRAILAACRRHAAGSSDRMKVGR